MENMKHDKVKQHTWLALITTLITSLSAPTVIIALITAVAGPIALLKFEDENQTRKLQEQLLSQIMDNAGSKDQDGSYSDRMAVIFALVQDNKDEFGLKFPTADMILKQRNEITTHHLLSELTDQTAKTADARSELAKTTASLAITNDELKTNKTAITGIQEKITSLEKNRTENQTEIDSLKARKGDLEKLTETKEQEKRELTSSLVTLTKNVDELNQKLLNSQKDIERLTDLDKESTERINKLTKESDENRNKADMTKQDLDNTKASLQAMTRASDSCNIKLNKFESMQKESVPISAPQPSP